MRAGKLTPGLVPALLCMAAGALALYLTTLAAPASAAEGCANEARRVEQASTFLPDCRAYELVSPPGATVYLNPNGRVDGTRAAAVSTLAGGAIGWFSYYPPPGLDSAGTQLLSTREVSGWKTQDAIPPQSTNSGILLACNGYMYLSGDLTKGILADGRLSIGAEQGNQELCGHNEPALVEHEPEGFQNLFSHDFGSAAYSLVNLTPNGVVPSDAQLQDVSTDFSHVAFSESAALTKGAPDGEDLYEWVDGEVRLVSVLPDGVPVPGRLVDSQADSFTDLSFAPFVHGISSNGSRVFFETGGHLYVRTNIEQEQSALGAKGECLEQEKACTLVVDLSKAGGVGGGGGFVAANENGTSVLFTDGGVAKLTSDTVAASGQNLYEFDVDTGQLTDLTPFAQAGVLGLAGLGEASRDTERLYVVATGVLSGANVEGHSPQAGSNNLYEINPGQSPVFVATLANADAEDWEGELRQAEASPNGRYLAFSSTAPLTGYDNSDASTSEPDPELFLYDADINRLSCVSCASTARPVGPSVIASTEKANVLANSPGYLRRNVLNDGRVFFDTINALVSEDVNGQSDVYEYENGQLHLISSGTSKEGSYFYEASGMNLETGQEGEDVFFASSQTLLAADTANGPVLYDARVNGGFASQSEPAQIPPCEAIEGCRSPLTEPPAELSVASAALVGAGNLAQPAPPPSVTSKPKAKAKIKMKPCRKSFVRRHGKCVKRARKTKRAAKGRRG